VVVDRQSGRTQINRLPDSWPLIVGFLVLAAPTIAKLAGQNWTEESGAQGPIILVTGAWLIWRLIPHFEKQGVRGNPWVIGILLAASLIAYVFGSIVDLITFEAGGLFGAGVTLLYATFGARVLLRNWFPLFYLAFAVPPPAYLVTSLTAPLKEFVSRAATNIVAYMGLPVSREGVVINIAQYQLLVEDACSGMNSIFGLLAIGLFYIYLIRGSSLRYSILLAALMIPIAVAANIVRVIFVILLTYYFGDEVGQGFLHFAAGIFLFVIALLLVFALDGVLHRLFFAKARVPA
jgi:exosortase